MGIRGAARGGFRAGAWSEATTGNACVLAMLAAGACTALMSSDTYLRICQEDEVLEWATFWSLALASGLHLRSAWPRGWRQRWFPAAVGIACFVLAMEEISWGQRLLGLRPPEYFLENNFQQEMNAHNLLPKMLRKLSLTLVLAGYGIALPLARARWRTRRPLARLGIPAVPVSLVPLFLLALLLYLTYPVRLTGEWVELLLGLGLLLSAVLARRGRPFRGRPRAAVTLAAIAGVTVLAVSSAAWSRHERAASPQAVARARVEIEALQADLVAAGLPGRDRMHRRVATYVKAFGQAGMRDGRFRNLTGSGLPEERALFFLDPWNSPYWVKASRSRTATTLLVYSLGANRLRETVALDPAGDDVGLRIDLAPSTQADPAARDDDDEATP